MWKLQDFYEFYAHSVCKETNTFERFLNYLKTRNAEGYSEFEVEYLNDVLETITGPGKELNIGLENVYSCEINDVEVMALTVPMVNVLKDLNLSKYSSIVDMSPAYGNSTKIEAILNKPYKTYNETEDIEVYKDSLCILSLKQYQNLVLRVKDLKLDLVVFVNGEYLENIKSTNFHNYLAQRKYTMKTLKLKECINTESKKNMSVFYIADSINNEIDNNVEYFTKDELEPLIEYNVQMPKFSEDGDVQEQTLKVPINYLAFMKNNFKTKMKADIYSYHPGYSLVLTEENILDCAEYYAMLNLNDSDTSKRIPKYQGKYHKEFQLASLVWLFLTNENIQNYDDEWHNRLCITFPEEPSNYTFYLDKYLEDLFNNTKSELNSEIMIEIAHVVSCLREKYIETWNTSEDLTKEEVSYMGVYELYEALNDLDTLQRYNSKIKELLKGMLEQ